MNATIKASDGKCPFCTGKDKDKSIFEVKGEGFSGLICGSHLHGYLKQKEEQAVPENGRPHAATT